MSKKKPPYFHVVVWIKPFAGIARLLHSDQSEAELKRNFLTPYRRGRRTVLDGEIIDLRDISTVKIVKTELNKDDELQALQNRSTAEIDAINRSSPDFVIIARGQGWEDEEIADCGEDVTAQYVKVAPGEASFISTIVAHPWTVGLGTTVLAGILLFMLGLGG